jgi:glycosyltransferase involved in cell wall biosynthesis
MASDPSVSIVIPTRNSSKTLPICLSSISRQRYRNIEVIVVDNYSEDDTEEIAMRFGASVYIVGPERSVQKNYGASVARGEIIYFIDSDFYLSPWVVEECVDLIRGGADAVIVLNVSDPRVSTVARVRYFERLSYYGSGLYEAARCMKRSWFFKVGGFDPGLYANEEYDLHARLVKAGARIARTRRGFEVHLGEPASIGSLIIRDIYYGGNIARYFRKNPRLEHVSPFRPTFLSRWFIAWAGRRWMPALILVPALKFVEGLSILLGILFRIGLDPYRRVDKSR